MIRLGCLFSDAARAGFFGDTFAGTGLARGTSLSPAQAKAGQRTYEAIVRLETLCAAFQLELDSTRAVVEPAMHMAERGNHVLVNTVLSAMRILYEKHTVSAMREGAEATMAKYAGYVRHSCVWACENASQWVSIWPVSRHWVLLLLEAESSRRLVWGEKASTRWSRRA